MSVRNLQAVLHPSSLALVGGSARPGSLGALVLTNILEDKFAGPVTVVNPHPVDVRGTQWVASVDALQTPPDLAVVVAPAIAVPAIIADLGKLVKDATTRAPEPTAEQIPEPPAQTAVARPPRHRPRRAPRRSSARATRGHRAQRTLSAHPQRPV